MKLKQSVLAASMLLLSAVTFADPIIINDGTYQLKNHPDGNAAPPPYGLRLDGLLNGNQGTIYTFDFNAEGFGDVHVAHRIDPGDLWHRVRW